MKVKHGYKLVLRKTWHIIFSLPIEHVNTFFHSFVLKNEKIFHVHNHKLILLRHTHKMKKKLKKNYLVTSVDIIQLYFLLILYVCRNNIYLDLWPSKYISFGTYLSSLKQTSPKRRFVHENPSLISGCNNYWLDYTCLTTNFLGGEIFKI